MNLTENNKNIISGNTFRNIKDHKVVLVNTARGDLINSDALLKGLDKGNIKAYLTDVLDEEPMPIDHPLLSRKDVLITPHIGSRTYESVERQGTMAVNNLLKYL